MQLEQKQAFAARMSRIHSGSQNTCGTIHVGDTTSAKMPRNVLAAQGSGAPSVGAMMTKGLLSALFQVLLLGAGLTLYIRHVGL